MEQLKQVTAERDEARHDATQAHGVAQALERHVIGLQVERDEARALLRRCASWFEDGPFEYDPDADRLESLTHEIKALLKRV